MAFPRQRGIRRASKFGEAAFQPVELFLRKSFQIEQLIAGGFSDPDQFVEFQVKHGAVTVLGVLN